MAVEVVYCIVVMDGISWDGWVVWSTHVWQGLATLDWTRGGQTQEFKTDTPVGLHGQHYSSMLINDWLSVSFIEK